MRRAIIVLIALAVGLGTRASSAAKAISVDTWMSVYMGPVKVGYQHVTVARDTSEGECAYRLCEMRATAIRTQGVTHRATYTDTLFLDAGLRPLSGVSEKIDDGVTTLTSARFFSDRVECTQTTGEQTVTKVIAIPQGADLSVRPAYLAGRLAPSAGESISAYGLDFSKMAFFHNELRAVERRPIIYRGANQSALIVRYGDNEQDMTDWRLDTGEIIRTEIPRLGTQLVATTSKDALAEVALGDLGKVEADKPIPDPSHARDLSLRLTGVPDKGFAISDSRQSAEFDSKELSVTYRIHAAPFDPRKSATLPIRRRGLATWLQPGKGIESNDRNIAAQARSIVGSEKSAYEAARKLTAWVHDNVKQVREASAEPSAVAVLKDRAGLCRHNAVLYAALARAVGIPTRLASGIMYDGSAFAFHTWAESWVGQWVAMDPTFGGDLVDATHVKLLQGGVEDLSSIARVIGRLRAEILDPTRQTPPAPAHQDPGR